MSAAEQPSPLADEKRSINGSPAAASDSASTTTEVTYDAAEEGKLVRKIDLILLPSLSILYLLSFLDRSNIGNAKIDGMVTDLGLGNQYSTALTLFFVGYVLAEVPGNWGLKATNPPFWMPFVTLLFGIVSLTQGLVHNTSGLLAVRFFLGISESSLFPGVVFIFSQWYQRKERVVRVSFFFSAAAAAGAWGGLLAYAIGFMDGTGGKKGWQWIFILEGLLTIVVSFITFFTIPNYPTKTKWFSERELQILHHRLAKDSDALEDEGFNWSGVRQAMTDVKVYLYCVLFHGMSFPLYTISLFLPTIIQELGYASWKAQLLSTPPYVLAFIVTMATAWTAKRTGRRAPFILAGFCLAIVGYIVLIASPTVGSKYAATFIIVCGVYAANALLLAWPSENVAGATKRNTALAMVISIGNCGAIIGTQVYRIPLGGVANKNYRVSQGLTIVWLGIGIASCLSLWYILGRENARRDREIGRIAAGSGEGAQLEAGAGDDKANAAGVNLALAARLEKDAARREDIAREWRELGDRRLTWRYQL